MAASGVGTRSPGEFAGDHAARIVDDALLALGLDGEQFTTPSIIGDLLEQWKLANLKPSLPFFAEFLDAAKHRPQPLQPLIRGVRSALIADHPTVVRFLSEALARDWLRPTPEIRISLHFAYLLEAFTGVMVNNHEVFAEVRDCLMAGRRKYGIVPASSLSTFAAVLKLTQSPFAAAKTISVDPAVGYSLYSRAYGGSTPRPADIARLRQKGKLSFLEAALFKETAPDPAKDHHRPLRINIYEAGIAEHRNGFTDNALAAYVLAAGAKENSGVNRWVPGVVCPRHGERRSHEAFAMPGNLVREAPFSQDWVGLYETWNLAFVLGELRDVHLILPKLLIPSVLAAQPRHFLNVRILSLWMTINLILFRRLDQIPESRGPHHRRAMAALWGKINAQAALRYGEAWLGRTSVGMMASFQKRFRMPEAYFALLVAVYASAGTRFAAVTGRISQAIARMCHRRQGGVVSSRS